MKVGLKPGVDRAVRTWLALTAVAFWVALIIVVLWTFLPP